MTQILRSSQSSGLPWIPPAILLARPSHVEVNFSAFFVRSPHLEAHSCRSARMGGTSLTYQPTAAAIDRKVIRLRFRVRGVDKREKIQPSTPTIPTSTHLQPIPIAFNALLTSSISTHSNRHLMRISYIQSMSSKTVSLMSLGQLIIIYRTEYGSLFSSPWQAHR